MTTRLKICFGHLFLILSYISSYAGDSIYTRTGAAPRYWIAYEYCWVNNVPIPEDRWKKNIDWMAEHFLSYGYDMVCNDGWIEQAQTVNADGYIVKYNDSWQHSFAYWGDYLRKKGMKMGVYYNPMWMTRTAYDLNVQVAGTPYRAQDIAGARSFNEPLYWVDATRPGAKEWIQGYVRYFKSCGAKFLRIDFLENYERNYGTVNYELCLRWIREAAGDDLFLSLVMPNCYEHGATELKYGDMIRIDDDCFAGGWDFFSDRRRGQRNPVWPQYGNAFDGFIAFSDIGGRGQMMLDGDFIRLNTLADDRERMSMISLFTLAGSPITIADQYDTAGGTEWAYQNRELLALHDAGLVCKPVSHDDKDVYNSSRWVGQLPNGDWIVGLFNREKNNQVRSVDLVRDLGLDHAAVCHIRDLWTHQDLDTVQGGFTADLAPHACQVLKIRSGRKRYQAEVASLMKGAVKGHTNFGYDGFGYAAVPSGGQVLIAVEVKKKGKYKIMLRYRHDHRHSITVPAGLFGVPADNKIILPPVSGRNSWSEAALHMELEGGVNYLVLGSGNSSFDLDWMELIEK